MPPYEPDSLIYMHPTTPKRLKERQKALEAEQAREAEPLVLSCGCTLSAVSYNAVLVTYCKSHSSFHYSARPGTHTDLFYFVTEEGRP